MKNREDQRPEENENQKNSNPDKEKKGKRHFTAAELDALTNSATDSVRARRHHDTLSNTGTNVSYEGTTPAGGAGSVGTGQGQNATGARISTDNTTDHVRTKSEAGKKEQDEDNEEGKESGNLREQEESEK